MSRMDRGSRRIDYAGSVHDEREIEAVVGVLRGGPTALRIGRNVREMEKRVAELFAKRRGVMCNSGSSALYLAIESLGLDPSSVIRFTALRDGSYLVGVAEAEDRAGFDRTYTLSIKTVELVRGKHRKSG